MTTYSFDDFDYVDRFVILPANTVLYRGVPDNVTEVLQNYPIYLAPEEIAKLYGKLKIKLIDIRKMIGILKYILSTIRSFDNDTMNSVAFLSIAFGLVSYRAQINTIENYYKQIKSTIKPEFVSIIQNRINNMKTYNFNQSPHNPIEIQGVRTGDIKINGLSLMIIKELFSGLCDGYIAPRMFSPYQEEGFVHEEIVIFDPKNKNIEIVDTIDANVKDISDILTGTHIRIKQNRIDTKMWAGSMIGYKISADPNSFFNNKDDVKEGKRLAKKFIKTVASKFVDKPAPMIDPYMEDIDKSKFDFGSLIKQKI